MHSGNKWVAATSSLLGAALFALGLPLAAQIAVPQQWESGLHGDHPLVGKIWHSAGARFIDSAEFQGLVEGASYLLLGEKHDNPDHHALQLTVLEHLLATGAVAGVAFEMMESDDQQRLDRIDESALASLDSLRDYLQWNDEGWSWEFYGPLIAAAGSAAAPIRAANITDATMGEVYGGAAPDGIAGVLDGATMEQLNRDIDESHCGLLPQSQFPAMVRVQQARDLAMAQSMVEPGAGAVSVLIAGNYHVRQDLGVPNYLLAGNGSVTRDDIVSVAFMEVQPGETDAAAYLERFGQQAAYDLIWFTPVISEEDYCASLRAR